MPASAASEPASLRLALPALAGVAAAYVLWRFAADRSPVPPRIVLAALPVYLALWLATVALHALRWRMVLHRLGADLPLGRLARLWLAARAVGSVVPSGTLGGEPIRAQLLTTSGMSAASAAGAVALDRSLELAGNMIVGPICIFGAIALGAGSDTAMAATALFALAGLGLLAFVYVRAAQGRPALVPLSGRPLWFVPRRLHARVRAHAERADVALQELLAAHPRLVPAGVGLSLVIEGLHLVELTALFAVFALAVPLPMLLLSSMGIGIAHALPVTAALGTLEATQIGLFTVGGAPIATGIAVAVAIRLAETLAILVGLACLATARARA
jgi:glycosyltransferase 2 family protein